MPTSTRISPSAANSRSTANFVGRASRGTNSASEGGAPAERLAQRRAAGHAEHVGEREAGEHQRHRLRALPVRREIGGDYGADAEERGVGKGGERPRRHQHAV
jgi:hypothetical protein